MSLEKLITSRSFVLVWLVMDADLNCHLLFARIWFSFVLIFWAFFLVGTIFLFIFGWTWFCFPTGWVKFRRTECYSSGAWKCDTPFIPSRIYVILGLPLFLLWMFSSVQMCLHSQNFSLPLQISPISVFSQYDAIWRKVHKFEKFDFCFEKFWNCLFADIVNISSNICKKA